MKAQTLDQSEIYLEQIDKEIVVLESFKDAPCDTEQFQRMVEHLREIEGHSIEIFFKECSEKLYQVGQTMLNRKKLLRKNLA